MTCVVLETSGDSVFVVGKYPMPGIAIFIFLKKPMAYGSGIDHRIPLFEPL